MTWLLNSVKQIFFNFIAPPFCIGCHVMLAADTILCTNCFGGIAPLATKTLPITSRYSARVFAVSDYCEPLRSLVLAKHQSNRLAAKQLGRLMWQRTDLSYADFDIIVPVPLHWTRYAWRWFNQAEVIAQELSKKSGKPVIQLLYRAHKTEYQTRLTRQKRLNNLKDAFQLVAGAEQYKGKKILLVDDVMTTGTTLHHCLRTLVKIAPKEDVIVGVACRTL